MAARPVRCPPPLGLREALWWRSPVEQSHSPTLPVSHSALTPRNNLLHPQPNSWMGTQLRPPRFSNPASTPVPLPPPTEAAWRAVSITGNDSGISTSLYLRYQSIETLRNILYFKPITFFVFTLSLPESKPLLSVPPLQSTVKAPPKIAPDLSVLRTMASTRTLQAAVPFPFQIVFHSATRIKVNYFFLLFFFHK